MDEVIWTRDDMILATLEYWGDASIRARDCKVVNDPRGYLYVVHVPTGRTSDEAGNAGRWNLDGTAR